MTYAPAHAVDIRPTPSRPPAPAAPPGEVIGDGERSARWVRPALILLLGLTALGYIWDLSSSGYANSFYAAAVQAGTKSWKAFLFGSLDPSNFITVDKPPASLWVMELSGRIFGFSSWSMLVPQALEGVAAVGLVYASVRRWFGAPAGLLAGAALAATPVAALMFRFNNPDALLVLLLVASAYALTRALEKAGTRWIVAAGGLLGLAFLAKMLQAFTVLPAFGLVYLVAAPTTLRRRIGQLALGGVAVVVAAGWWVALVELWPAGSRPYVDGSPDNSILNLIFSYNGLGRLSGSTGGGSNFSGAAGIFRLFNDLMGGQASWLLPAALAVVIGGLLVTARTPRTDRTRAAIILWGGWLVVTGAVFSFSKGVIHTYYTVALAPAIAALVGIGAALLWRYRARWQAGAVAAVAIEGTAVWAYELLDRTPTYHPWLRVSILALGSVAALILVGLAAASLVGAPMVARHGRRLATFAIGAGLLASLAAPVAYAATTVTTAHTGSLPTAGPASNASGFGGGGFGGGPGGGAPGGFGRGGSLPSGSTTGGFGSGAPSGGSGSFGSSSSGTAAAGFGSASTSSAGKVSVGGSALGGAGATPGAGGGGGTTTSATLVAALRSDAHAYKWAAATDGSQIAATLELASGEAVMAIGGFNGEGGNLTLAQFEAYVAKGEIHYYIAGGGSGGGPGGGSSDSAITSWVAAHYKAETIGGETVYDLSAAK
jgi:4-amino-4-deoxy-L-arabinose transferase-like glycosyltransferase